MTARVGASQSHFSMNVHEIALRGPDGAWRQAFEKRLSSRERGTAQSVARLRSEATLLDRLGGRVTPLLLGAGDDAQGPWLRTARVSFPTLAHRIVERQAFSTTGALDAEWVERAVRTAFAALVHLHEACDALGALSIVHADLSPANVAIDDDAASAIFLDLELARWRGAKPRDGAFCGTIAYCAPELARCEPATVESDLFALAATLLHATTGIAPRTADALSSLATRIVEAAERPVLETLENAIASLRPAALAARGPAHAALFACLAHRACERPTSARAVLALLGEVRV